MKYYCPLGDCLCENGKIIKFGEEFNCINQSSYIVGNKLVYKCNYFNEVF